jgi:hypothetical protein
VTFVPSFDFAHTYRFAFGAVLLVGGGFAVVLLVAGAVAPSLLMALVGLALAAIVIGYLGTNAFAVALRDGQLHLRTGLGRTYDVPLSDVTKSSRGVPRRPIAPQLAVRWPGKRISVTIPKYPPGPTRQLLAAINTRPEPTR